VRPDEDLYCTDTGQVVTATDSPKVFQVNVETFEKLRPDLTQVFAREQLCGTVAETLGMSLPVEVAGSRLFDPSTAGMQASGDTDYHLLTIQEGLYAGLFVKTAAGQANSVRLLVSEAPDYARFEQAEGEAGVTQALLTTCGTGIFDLSCHGLQMYEQQGGNPTRLHGREVFAANYAKLMGFSLLRLRVTDILAALSFLRSECGYQDVLLEGHGRGGIWALHAALMDGAVAGLRLEDALWSYQLTLRDGQYTLPHTADIARGSLLQYDLPQLCAALAPMPLEIVRPLDSRGEAYDVAGTHEFEMVQQAYAAYAHRLLLEC
jgi:hypothetical protein